MRADELGRLPAVLEGGGGDLAPGKHWDSTVSRRTTTPKAVFPPLARAGRSSHRVEGGNSPTDSGTVRIGVYHMGCNLAKHFDTYGARPPVRSEKAVEWKGWLVSLLEALGGGRRGGGARTHNTHTRHTHKHTHRHTSACPFEETPGAGRQTYQTA